MQQHEKQNKKNLYIIHQKKEEKNDIINNLSVGLYTSKHHNIKHHKYILSN